MAATQVIRSDRFPDLDDQVLFPRLSDSKLEWLAKRGQPDLQGVWTNNTVTPLERPKDLAGKEFYTDAEKPLHAVLAGCDRWSDGGN